MAKQKKFAKAKWAEILGVSTSGYYTWLQEYESRKQKRETLSQKVISIFASGKGTYGTDRICGILRRDGQPASYPVVKQSMEEKGLKSWGKRELMSIKT
jgi:putative transposase